MDRIKVVIFEPGKAGRVDYIPNKLRAMQQVVGGNIETVRIATDAVIVCNEEGRLLGLPENRFGIVGTFFVAGDDGGVELVSLSREQVNFLLGEGGRNHGNQHSGSGAGVPGAGAGQAAREAAAEEADQ